MTKDDSCEKYEKGGKDMGKKDIAAKKWLSDKGRFSDMCNAVLFGGEQVVSAEDLERADSESDMDE